MTPEEALDLIRETNEPLAVILEHILQEQRHNTKVTDEIVRVLLEHAMTNPDKPFTLDLSFLVKILRTNSN